jgi:hypothetical protein
VSQQPHPAADAHAGGRLASIDAPVGSLIAYATAPGRTASDGEGGNSPFAAALAEEMLAPGLPIETVMKRVRVRVQQASGGEQIPWQSSSLTREFFFIPEGATPASAAAGGRPMGWSGSAMSPEPEGTSPPPADGPDEQAPDDLLVEGGPDVEDEAPVRRRRSTEATATRRSEETAPGGDTGEPYYDYTWADYAYYGAFGTALATWPACGVFLLGGTVGLLPAIWVGQWLTGTNLALLSLCALAPPFVCLGLTTLMPFVFVGSVITGGCFSVVRVFVDRDGPMPPSLQSRRSPPGPERGLRPPERRVASMAF